MRMGEAEARHTGETARQHAVRASSDRYPETVVTVVGRLDRGEVPQDTSFHFTADLTRPSGLIAVLSGQHDKVFAKLWQHGHALTPLADFTRDQRLPRADIRPGYFAASTLADAMAATRQVRAELRALPALTAREDQTAYAVLALAATRGVPIAADWAPDEPDMVGFPLLAGLQQASPVLAGLADAGLITRRFFDRVHLCGQCAGARLIAREVCATCGSANLHDADLIHHYRCGYQGPRANFQRPDTHHLICYKCNRVVRHYGVDYDIPGTVSVCLGCGDTASDPPVALACADCRANTRAEDARTRDWFHYDLAPAGRDAVIQGRLPVTDLGRMLESRDVPGHQAPRDLATLIAYARRVHARYERPFLVMTVQPDVSQVDSVAERSRIYARMADVISDTLRDSDFLTALNQQIVILLPETPADRAQRVRERLDASLNKAMGEHGKARIDELDPDALDEILTHLYES